MTGVDPADIDAMLAYATNRQMVWIRLGHTKGWAYADQVKRLCEPIILARYKGHKEGFEFSDDDDIPF